MEELLHYVWKHRLFYTSSLKTTDQKDIEILDTGIPNMDAGPDFFNAKVKVGYTTWVGNVEIHCKSSDWYRHGHDRDVNYDSTILHVVGCADQRVFRTTGEAIPQFVLTTPQKVLEQYNILKKNDFQPRCYAIIPKLEKIFVNNWLAALQVERLEAKYSRIITLLSSKNYQWNDIFFIVLARSFGFGLNGDTFERWARQLPFRALDKHRDSLFQIEAIMFGKSGLLPSTCCDEYTDTLQNEFCYLQSKFELETTEYPWKLARIRPGSFPHIRIAQLAYFYHTKPHFINSLFATSDLKQLYSCLDFGESVYWMTHFSFGKEHPKYRSKNLTKKTKELLIINAIVPFMYTYGRHTCNDLLADKALKILNQLGAENNYISRLWHDAGIDVTSAADSQALVQLQKEYCDKKKCFYCRFGYKFMAE